MKMVFNRIIVLFLLVSLVFVACQDKPAPSAMPPSAPALPDTLCFQHSFHEDRTTLQLIMRKDSVFGDYNWMPHEKDGAIGTVKGVKKGDTLVVDYKYMMEGSEQEEQVYFLMLQGAITTLQGELEDKNGKMVLKDVKKAVHGDTLKAINCAQMAPKPTME